MVPASFFLVNAGDRLAVAWQRVQDLRNPDAPVGTLVTGRRTRDTGTAPDPPPFVSNSCQVRGILCFGWPKMGRMTRRHLGFGFFALSLLIAVPACEYGPPGGVYGRTSPVSIDLPAPATPTLVADAQTGMVA
jgi:hypothetical protein